jgi:class 3 adenylate cyclase
MAEVTFADPLLRRELRGAALVGARAVAGTLCGLAVVLFIRGIPSALVRAAERAQLAITQGHGESWFEPASVLVVWIGIAAAVVWLALAALILWRRSRDLFGIFLAVGFVAIGVIVVSVDQILINGGAANVHQDDALNELGRSVVWLLTAFSLVWIFAFPDGRIAPRWTIALLIFWAAWALLRIPFPAEFAHQRYGTIGGLLYTAAPLTGLGTLIYRFVRASDPVQRVQLKWFVYGGVLIVAAWVTGVLVPLLGVVDGSVGSQFIYRTLSSGWLAAASVLLPLTIAIAIFRQGLFNIDLLISRTLMYSVLTVVLVAAFVIIGTIAQRAYAAVAGSESVVVTLIVAVPIALAFIPLRTRMQSIADRFLSDRAVLTVVFLDLSGSTAKAAQLGDRAWRETLERYRSVVRREMRRLGGREIDTAGDGFFVTFGSPGTAIRFAGAAIASIRGIGLDARAGLHVGEVEVQGSRVSGIGVHIGARIVAAASAGEVLVSRTLRDLVAGSDIRLADRGMHGLKGVPGRWHLYSVVSG